VSFGKGEGRIRGGPDAGRRGACEHVGGKGVTAMTATLVRWSPFRDLELTERGMRRMFEGFGWPPATLPAADVYETKDEFVVELEIPGYQEKELGIEVSDHVLTVKGKREEVKEEKEKAFAPHERLEKEFERRFVLPEETDTGMLKAVFKQGVLEVHAPKTKALAAKKIPIGKA
jgi:HSP20 family protein